MELSPRRLTLLWVVVGLMVASSVTVAYLRQGPEAVTMDAAVEQFHRDKEAGGPTGTSIAPDGSPVPDAAPEADAGPGAVAPTGPAATGGGSSQTTRNSETGAPPPRPVQEGEGVYPHTTTGYEETDAMGGSRHDYPSETPVAHRRTDCGLITRWQPLKERWDESSFCQVDQALEIRTFTTYHEFFQKGDRQDYRCPPGSVVFDRREPAGASWMWNCDTAKASIDTQTRVIGIEQMTIEGVTMDTVHMHYESRLSGATEGTQVQDRWIEPDSGLVVRVKSEMTAQTDSPFGRVGYEEQYDITMKSLKPRT